ncbi:MAG: hypothetical protein IPK81_23655 [Rhodospirillales bacterium]|nr:MAG: hypothetical protein IPK81_23655 [Rhodospirillales bacterium]
MSAMDSNAKIKMYGTVVGGVGVLVGGLIVLMNMLPELLAAAPKTGWAGEAGAGQWSVVCRDNRLQQRKECVLESAWTPSPEQKRRGIDLSGVVRFNPQDGRWSVTTLPSSAKITMKIDDNPQMDAACGVMCVMSAEQSEQMTKLAAASKMLLAEATTSAGQIGRVAVSLEGFEEAARPTHRRLAAK